MYYIVYSSVTFATGIKNHFRYSADYIGVLHTPAKISGGSCSYCLTVKNEAKAREIVKVSQDYGIKIKGIYKETEKDQYTEVLF